MWLLRVRDWSNIPQRKSGSEATEKTRTQNHSCPGLKQNCGFHSLLGLPLIPSLSKNDTGKFILWRFQGNPKRSHPMMGLSTTYMRTPEQKLIKSCFLGIFCVGDTCYHELSMTIDLPRSYLVKPCRDNLSKMCRSQLSCCNIWVTLVIMICIIMAAWRDCWMSVWIEIYNLQLCLPII